jgi:hypothetical protein
MAAINLKAGQSLQPEDKIVKVELRKGNALTCSCFFCSDRTIAVLLSKIMD